MSDITTGYAFTDGEKGITAQKENDQVNQAVINPAFVSAKPLASSVASTDQMLILNTANSYVRAPFSTVSNSVAGLLPLADNTTNGMMRMVSGSANDFVDGTNHCQAIASSPAITQMRLRSFNAVGNPNAEVCQRNISATLTNPVSGTFVEDRWSIGKNGTMAVNAGRTQQQVVIPGTNFVITAAYFHFTLTTAQATLAAGDYFQFSQTVEGIGLRELSGDVHSASMLVQSSVAGLKFGLSICDPTGSRSLCKLCTIPSANTWTLITLPNLPIFPGAGTFSVLPGNAGYLYRICLGSGSTYTAPANDTWQNGNFIGASGQSNFAASAVNSTFDIAFVQHEPGPVSTTLIDKPFTQNLDECLRYYYKTYHYGTAKGTAITSGMNYTFRAFSVNGANGFGVYGKRMANNPTITLYAGNGSAPGVTENVSGGGVTVTGAGFISDECFTQVTASGTLVQNSTYGCHYTADTGW